MLHVTKIGNLLFLLQKVNIKKLICEKNYEQLLKELSIKHTENYTVL